MSSPLSHRVFNATLTSQGQFSTKTLYVDCCCFLGRVLVSTGGLSNMATLPFLIWSWFAEKQGNQTIPGEVI